MEARFLEDNEIKDFGKYMSTEIHPTYYRIIGCYEQNKPIGVLVLDFVSDSIALVEWIYVDSASRKKGAAKEMVKFLTEWAEENRMIIQLNYKFDYGLNNLFMRYGFEAEVEFYPNYSMEFEKATKILDKIQLNDDSSFELVPLEDVTSEQLMDLIDSHKENEENELPVSEDLLFEAEQGMSRVLIVDGKIEGLIYLMMQDSVNVKVTYLWSSGKIKMTPIVIFADAYKWLKEYKPQVKIVNFLCIDEKLCTTIEKTFDIYPQDYIRIITASYYGLGRR